MGLIGSSEESPDQTQEGCESTTPTTAKHHSSESGLEEMEHTVQKRIGSMATSGRYHHPPKHLSTDYLIETNTVLGSGYNGDVHKAVRKTEDGTGSPTAQKFAVKEFKLRGSSQSKRDELKQECEIFLQMDHPHVARLTDVYEEEDRISLVMECLEGGELFDRVIEKKRFLEADAAKAAYQMTLALNYLHSHEIVHRDIKLENWMYEKKNTDHLKLIDFGFSKIYEANTKMKASCGTLSYVAPEVLNKNYTSKCDMWSLGVVVFILLGGYMPFSGADEVQIKKIKAGSFTFKEDKWKHASKTSVDFVKKLMVVNPEVRLSAEQALKHTFLTTAEQAQSKDDDFDMKDVSSNLCEFAQATKFRRTCMLAMAWSLSQDERSKVRQAFMKMDQNKHGTITLAEFKSVIEENFHLSDEKVEEMFNALDAAHNHEIQYSEFLAAMCASRIDLHDDLIASAFRRFDKDNTGYIDSDNLKAVLTDASDQEIEDMMKEVDENNDGKISHEEFMAYIRSGKATESHQEHFDAIIDKEVTKDEGTEAEGAEETKPSKVGRRTSMKMK